jgi:hypothetical protein
MQDHTLQACVEAIMGSQRATEAAERAVEVSRHVHREAQAARERAMTIRHQVKLDRAESRRVLSRLGSESAVMPPNRPLPGGRDPVVRRPGAGASAPLS